MTADIDKRILFVISSLTVGGAERQLTLLACNLALRGWQVTVFALNGTGYFLDRLECAGVKVLDGGYRPGSSRLHAILMLFVCFLRILKHTRRLRPAVLHAFLPLTNFLGSIVGRICSVPLIVTSRRGLGRHQERHREWAWIDRIANYCSHVITANAKAIASDAAQRDGISASDIVIIPNGLELFPDKSKPQIFNGFGVASGQIVIICVANLIAYKGHADLLNAFASLVHADDRLHLVLVGDDRGLGSSLKRQTVSLAVAHRVEFLGHRSDVGQLLAAADVGVLSSHEEGLSNALIEMLSAGLPVVATDVGGNSEVLQGMPGCQLVQPSDPHDLARGLRAVIENLPEPSCLVNERSEIVRLRYSLERMVDAYEDLYFKSLFIKLRN